MSLARRLRTRILENISNAECPKIHQKHSRRCDEIDRMIRIDNENHKRSQRS